MGEQVAPIVRSGVDGVAQGYDAVVVECQGVRWLPQMLQRGLDGSGVGGTCCRRRYGIGSADGSGLLGTSS